MILFVARYHIRACFSTAVAWARLHVTKDKIKFRCLHFFLVLGKKVKVGNDQEMVQSRKDYSYSKNRGGKT